MGYRGGSSGSPPSTFAERKYDAEQREKADLEQELEAGNRFLLERGEERMPTSKEGRYSVLRNLRAGKGVTPPARMVKEDSPVVEQLPDHYKAFGRDVEEAVESGELSARVGMSLIQAKQSHKQWRLAMRSLMKRGILIKYLHNLKNQSGERDMSGSIVVQ